MIFLDSENSLLKLGFLIKIFLKDTLIHDALCEICNNKK